jgi:hypothetical protein
MYSEPKNRADILQDAAAMANGNLRLTRVLNVLLLHLANKTSAVRKPALAEWEEAACSALEVLAATPQSDEQALQQALSRLEEIDFGSSDRNQNSESWVFTQVARASTELSAMLIDALPPREKPDPSR